MGVENSNIFKYGGFVSVEVFIQDINYSSENQQYGVINSVPGPFVSAWVFIFGALLDVCESWR